jgi:hypothetical protein
MSQKYPGGIITKNYVAPTPSSAQGIWTLDQQLQAQKAGIWPFGGPFNYIEDVFSTWLYTGTNADQTIINGIDLSGKGGLVWNKVRGATGNNSYHYWVDTARGRAFGLASNATDAQYTSTAGTDLTAFTSTGYTLGPQGNFAASNNNGASIVSWTFREQPKFFDIVTYTGNGVGARSISHNLGAAPGCIIVKCTSAASNWMVWHVSLAGQDNLRLNTTDSVTGVTDPISVSGWPSSMSTTAFDVAVGSGSDLCNVTGATYVAYLFANNAGGFGLTGTDNVISCGSFTADGAGKATVTLGYEPQWFIVKSSNNASSWSIVDNMRGMPVGSADSYLNAESSAAEATADFVSPTATGMDFFGLTSGWSYIYVAIRRGPMKVPTTGTSVFSPDLYTGNGTTQSITSGSPPLDLVWIKGRTGSNSPRIYDRLRGATKSLSPDTTAAETTRSDGLTAFTQTGFTVGSFGNENESGVSIIAWDFRRAPSFFDEVCYTGTGSARTVSHNLAAVPELMIIKQRSGVNGWPVYSSGTGNTKFAYLNATLAFDTNSSAWNNTSPTSSVFTVGSGSLMNTSAATYIAYLFATCPGVSKVGSYTGTGAAQTINCGFTAGARFVLIKRTDDTGDWYVWDSARGIIPSNDPYLLLNTSTNEVTGTDYVDTTNVGFDITSTAPAAINANGGTFIFLAIA